MTAPDLRAAAPATQVVHGGTAPAVPGGPYLAGPVFAAPYHAPGDPAASPFTYGRFHNPTWQAYEEALALLEGGPCLLFPSGMAATSAVLATLVPPGGTVVMLAGSYYTTRVLATQAFAGGWMQAQGVTVRLLEPDGTNAAALLEGASLLWLESPTNPELAVCDIAALAALARAAGARVAVDNTTATPLLQQPLALGADVAVVSDTKAMTGHGDLLLGHVAVRDAALLEPLRTWRTRVGAIAGPMEAWLAHRSLATLDVRLQRQCDSAEQLAAWLAAHPKVAGVRYPGLRSHPQHALAARQMRRFGGVISFELPDAAAVARFFGSARLVREATSFGGVHTSAERRARWGGDAVPEGFVRLSVGVEAADDLVADLAHALSMV
jgi:cystathionine gamma-lyase